MEEIYLATYGTLRKGQGNWFRFLSCLEPLGTFRVKGYQLYSNGAFPYAVPTRTADSIVVDVFKITEIQFLNCDYLEGYPHHYDRRRVRPINCELSPWMYYKTRKSLGERLSSLRLIPTGDWMDRLQSYEKELHL